MARRVFVIASLSLLVLLAFITWTWRPAIWGYVLLAPLIAVGLVDMLQPDQAIRRNFPVIGNLRYMFEAIRPEMQQYFIESDINGRPFSREQRSVVYQRAKGQLDTMPFGTRHDVYREGYQWMEHSIAPRPALEEPPRVRVGARQCAQPYDASLLNVGAMSYGALSYAAVLALNGAARDGHFAQNTGEGGLSPHHLAPGGDLIWQLGTGYFGARAPDGSFDPAAFQKRATLPNVKMIELKLSQGAKPGHGGILPASKVTPEISAIRGVPLGKDVLSPPWHTAFDGPTGLLNFLAELRQLSGGKPVGFKLCVGRRTELLALCRAMIETRQTPDFITVDGGEGGTGAAPLEFSNAMGWPLYDALAFVHQALVGVGMRDRVRIIASGRVVDGFDMALRIALGADLCYSARGMMFALGCIQALRCNNNSCPTGVATQDPALIRGLVVEGKRERVASFHRATVRHLLELSAAAGCPDPAGLSPDLIRRRVGPTETRTLQDLYGQMEPGALLAGRVPEDWREDWDRARADRF